MQHYISDSIYGLTLAWITSENSTKQLECQHLLTRSSLTVAGPSRHADSPLCYGVRSRLPLSVSRRQLPSAPLSHQLSCVPLPLPDPPRFQIQKPFVWFRAKTDKGIVCLAGHLHSVTCLPSESIFSRRDELAIYPLLTPSKINSFIIPISHSSIKKNLLALQIEWDANAKNGKNFWRVKSFKKYLIKNITSSWKKKNILNLLKRFSWSVSWFGLVWFYGISTVEGYSMPNLFLYI